MSTVPTAYFHTTALRQRFLDALDAGLRSQRLEPAEHAWLGRLAGTPNADEADPVRVDRLILDDGTVCSLELSAALLISHPLTENPRIYLYTLAGGLEGFAGRQQLLTALIARFAKTDAVPAFEYERVDTDPFRAQSVAIVEYQAGAVRQLTERLKRSPSLFSATTSAIARQLHMKLPDLAIDPATHLLRIVQPASGSDPQLVMMTQTLAQSAFEDYCKVSPLEIVSRQFLDASGKVASDAQAQLFSQALSESVAVLPQSFAELLNAYWEQPADGQSARAMAMESLRTSVFHELYRCAHEQLLTAGEQTVLQGLLQSASGTSPAGSGLLCKRLALDLGEHRSIASAGTFVLDFSPRQGNALLWFSPQHDVRRFASLSALRSFLDSPEGREMLRPALALADQKVLLESSPLQVTLQTIEAPLFAERIDSILALQARNLQYVVALSSTPEKVSAMFDDALDVRQLIDPRQLHFNAGRWSREVPIHFAAVWQSNDSDDLIQIGSRLAQSETVSMPQGGAGQAEQQLLSPSWLERTQVSDASAANLRQLDNLLSHYASQALQTYLCVASSPVLPAREVQVQWLESLPVDASDVEADPRAVSESERLKSMDLVSLLLERVSGHRPDAIPATADILLPADAMGTRLDVELINLMLERVAAHFVDGYLDHFQNAQTALARQGDRQLQPVGLALSLREDALRLDLALRKRLGELDDAVLSMVNQVLDAPTRTLRAGWGTAMTEVYSLSFEYDDQPPAVLSDTLVLRQPLNPAAGVMLWCGLRGWGHFPSLPAVGEGVMGAIDSVHRERWLDMFGESDRTGVRNHLQAGPSATLNARFDRLDGHAIEALQQSVLDRQKQNLQQLCKRAERCRLEAGLFTQLAREAELDEQLVNMLDALSVRIDTTLFKEMLPAWLKSASTQDVRIYNDIWRRYYLASDGDEDFLFGIPPLSDYARAQLIKQLGKDFPSIQWDPDQITVTLRRYVSGIPPVGQGISGVAAATIVRSESLTDYATNRFVDLQAAALSVEAVNQPEALKLLTPEYLRRMIRELDIGAGFMSLVRKALNPDDPEYAKRSRLFFEQLPPMMEAVAMQEKLEGNLSAQAFAFISRVVDMPDGIAREPVQQTSVVISSLRLVADQGMAADAVAGVYLICPAHFAEGPVVLHAIYNADFIFREYSSQAELHDDIRHNPGLQKLLLERLDPEVRSRYDHGGFIEPHLPFSVENLGDVPTRTPGPVTVELAEERGNALQFLFTDTVDLLIGIGNANTVTTAEADQAARHFLGSLGLDQALSFLPGKLATMVALWQSHTLFRASAASASGRRWGEAISEFSAALGVMATAREQSDKDELVGAELATGERIPPPIFSWGGVSLTAEQLIRLRALEVKNISLKDLRHDDLLSLYLDRNDDTPYAAVAGKVYQVRRRSDDGHWMIVGADGTPGPSLRLDARQRWELDLDMGLKGGGGTVTKMRSAAAQLNAEDVLLIEAKGMPEIRLFYRQRARHIGEAHQQAKRYLENCLDNLNVHTPGAALDPRVTAIIADFFGVSTPGKDLLIETERSVKGLFDAVMDASLSPYSSPRFVVGTNRPGHESTMAFVIKSDPKKRLFLTDRFFDAPAYPLSAQAAVEGFDYPTHYRATTLMHELSHLVLDTHDIAYLETTAPYPDLLLENNANNVKLKADLEHMQNYELSHKSEKDALFVCLDEGEWRDLEPDDGGAYGAILNITKCQTLDEAREVFLADGKKRSRILLSNADSVTLLVLRLGRYNYVLPAPAPETPEQPSLEQAAAAQVPGSDESDSSSGYRE